MSRVKQSFEPAFPFSCFLAGGPRQDAYFTLLRDNTVRVLIHRGGISCLDTVESVRKARKLVEQLKKEGWRLNRPGIPGDSKL